MLLPIDKMQRAADRFGSLRDGEMSAVYSFGGWRNLLKYRCHRYWEVLGCTTAKASKDQFDNGCGWWRHWTDHINAPTDPEEHRKRARYYSEHGVGTMYWKRNHGGIVHPIREGFVKEGHFSVTSKKSYIKSESKSEEININYNLNSIAKSLKIEHLLDSA